ncbi:MAG: DinB family protein [Bacteroidota bacterium]|jgi:uncharacterized damage-inducible protein DinB
MKIFKRPPAGTYPVYYDQYFAQVPSDQLIEELHQSHNKTQRLVLSFNNTFGDLRYAEKKWSIKEVLMHISDTERIFQYRILTIARADHRVIPGFDENHYAANSRCDQRTLDDIIEELGSVRHATITLISNLENDIWLNEGNANNNKVNIAALAYMICGHEIHHRNVIIERYVPVIIEKTDKKLTYD